ncbi:MAG: hypothetical protein WDW36_003907 [Sanguina aurantia]
MGRAGGNNFCNGWATSVGGRTLTLHQASVIGGLCDFVGALVLGAQTDKTLIGGTESPLVFASDPAVLCYGLMCALSAVIMWMVLATYLELPVSVTHSITSATLGMTMAYAGPSVVIFAKPIPTFPFFSGYLPILMSWVLSPVLCAGTSAVMFLAIRHFILRGQNSLERSFYYLPLLVFLASFIDGFLVLYKGASAALNWAIYQVAMVTLILCFVSTAFTIFVVMPYLRNRIMFDQRQRQAQHAAEVHLKTKEAEGGVTFASRVTVHGASSPTTLSGEGKDKSDEGGGEEESDADSSPGYDYYDGMQRASSHGDSFKSGPRAVSLWKRVQARVIKYIMTGRGIDVFKALQEDPHAANIHATAEQFDAPTEHSFKYLHVFSAMAFSFSFGANDIANTIGPFAAILATYQTGKVASTNPVPLWMLAMGGLGIMFGALLYGHNNVKSMGVRLTFISPSRGFCTQMSSALISALGARYGIPLSTTHCQTGAIIGVGMCEGRKGVNWRLAGYMVSAWVMTVIVTASLSAAIFAQGYFAPGVDQCSGAVSGLTTELQLAASDLLGSSSNIIGSLTNVTALTRAANASLTSIMNGSCKALLTAGTVVDTGSLLACVTQTLQLYHNVSTASAVLSGSNITASVALQDLNYLAP